MADKPTTLAEALLELQKKPINAKQSGLNPHYKSKYATLEDCWEACRKPLEEAGLIVVQNMRVIDGASFVVTRIQLASGPDGQETMVPVVAATDMQKLGSAITYARRYGLVTAVGILTGEDDDGNVASAPAPQVHTSNAPAQLPSDKQLEFVATLLKQRQVPAEAEAVIKSKLTDHSFTSDSISVVIDKLMEYPNK